MRERIKYVLIAIAAVIAVNYLTPADAATKCISDPLTIKISNVKNGEFDIQSNDPKPHCVFVK